MPKKPSLNVTKTGQGWRVEKPRSLSTNGKRERFFFKTRKEAQVFSEKLKEQVNAHGAGAQTIRPALAVEAFKAETMLQPYGISLTEAVRRIVEIEKAKVASKNVTTALAEFLLTKDDKSDAQKQTYDGRFGPGLPRVSDGSLLFLLHLISKMRPASDGGSRFGIVLNGSPLFTGGAGSGESEIRRHVLENDLVEAIVALPCPETPGGPPRQTIAAFRCCPRYS